MNSTLLPCHTLDFDEKFRFVSLVPVLADLLRGILNHRFDDTSFWAAVDK